MSAGMAEVIAAGQHDDFRWFGPLQGTQCRCGAMFYPRRSDRLSIEKAWRIHVFETTGRWPEELTAQTPDPLAAALADPEGHALVQAIHDRKAGA